MSLHPEKRTVTAREGAEALNVSERTVRRYMAQPRADYLAVAAERREAVAAMVEAGFTNGEIAEQLSISLRTIRGIKAALKTSP